MKKVSFLNLVLLVVIATSLFSCKNDETLVIDKQVQKVKITTQLDELELKEGDIIVLQLNAFAYDQANAIIKETSFDWQSNNLEVASISNDGLLSVQGYGQAIVYASVNEITDSIELNVVKPPSLKFTSSAPTSVDYNKTFRFTPFAESNDGEPKIEFIQIPNWMALDTSTNTLSGIPGWENVNRSFVFSLKATNDVTTISQSYSVAVNLAEIDCDSEFGEPSESLYILPFEVGKSFLINQGYCPSNPSWGHHNWFAYDFEMPIGTNVVAMRSGVVIATKEVFADGTRICGQENYIFIKHSDGTVASYYHLTKNGVGVNVGENVDAGDIIGRSGDSGCSIGPHLHVAVFRQQGPYDRQYTMPINFRNAEGQLNEKNGLQFNFTYKALPF